MSSNPPVFPTQMSLADPAHLVIHWSDGQRRRYTAAQLRGNCPCATCETSRSQGAAETGAPAPAATPLVIEGMKPVGNYAYRVGFSDGHATGIYPLELLHGLGENMEDEEKKRGHG